MPAGYADPHEYEGGLLNAPTSIKKHLEPPRSSPNALSLRIPPPSQPITFVADEEVKFTVKDDISNGDTSRRVFCPLEHHEAIVEMIEAHLCAHPLIPGYSHPSPDGIREWAVKHMYQFCVSFNLREVWAYLWENWYCKGWWELCARSQHPGILILKTTMIMESQ